MDEPRHVVVAAGIITGAVAATVATIRPWFSLRSIGLDVSWNGLGVGAGAHFPSHPTRLGLLVLAACVIALLAALILLLLPSVAGPVAPPALTVAAVATLAAAVVPVTVVMHPAWFFDNRFLTDLSIADLQLDPHGNGLMNTTTLILLALLLVVVSGLCLTGARTARRTHAVAPVTRSDTPPA